jgi:hypothetical protein
LTFCAALLSLGINALTGTIPTELGLLTKLTLLDLSENQLTGTVPTSLASLPLLGKSLFNHYCFCTILQLLFLTRVDSLGECVIETNAVVPFHSVLNLLLYCSTEDLHLGENELEGTIPTEIGELTKLSEYYFDWCKAVNIVVLLIIFDFLCSFSLSWDQFFYGNHSK